MDLTGSSLKFGIHLKGFWPKTTATRIHCATVVRQDGSGFPAVTFHFAEGAVLDLDAASMFIQTLENEFCMTLAPGKLTMTQKAFLPLECWLNRMITWVMTWLESGYSFRGLTVNSFMGKNVNDRFSATFVHPSCSGSSNFCLWIHPQVCVHLRIKSVWRRSRK